MNLLRLRHRPTFRPALIRPAAAIFQPHLHTSARFCRLSLTSGAELRLLRGLSVLQRSHVHAYVHHGALWKKKV